MASITAPAFAWMTPEAVVDASLAGLRHGGVICIPGFGNRVLAATVATIPRAVVRRLVGLAGQQIGLK